ncbi:NADPH:quinone reductase [Salimicrobium flavidum]|uniref:NADPH:quinone reductase n=1 Tax=Salimicrobium flavidum TaxID=570947 RepID=A0A1N7K9W2_9BACI|nr:NADPH:quinone reductase [Salimicrobium flavidum]
MKAIVATKYGSAEVLQLQEVEKPSPKKDEVLIKVHATIVTAGDSELRRFKMPPLFWLPMRVYFGVRKPRINILGQEFSGEIESVGKEVTGFKTGNPFFGSTQIRFGAYAEYVCLPSKYAITIKPDNMSFEEAATLPTGGLNALHFIRKANVQQGDKLLIVGAAGSIGTLAVQIAKSMGAEVTCIDSTEKLDMLRFIGADHVIDYTEEDFTKSGKKYDVIIDVVGKSPYVRTVKTLRQNGSYILGDPTLRGKVKGLWTSRRSDKKILFELAGYKKEDLVHLKELH